LAATAECNGVLFSLPPDDLEKLNWREQEYVPLQLDPGTIDGYEGALTLDDAEVWCYAAAEIALPNRLHPIVQSYVDTCVGGCLEIEEAYPGARAAGFARRFLETTSGWQEPWVNDRIFPWRPSAHEPRAWAVDQLILDVLGRETFDLMRVPGY
jgi:hypothetical protein